MSDNEFMKMALISIAEKIDFKSEDITSWVDGSNGNFITFDNNYEPADGDIKVDFSGKKIKNDSSDLVYDTFGKFYFDKTIKELNFKIQIEK